MADNRDTSDTSDAIAQLRASVEDAIGCDLDTLAADVSDVPDLINNLLNATSVAEAQSAAAALAAHLHLPVRASSPGMVDLSATINVAVLAQAAMAVSSVPPVGIHVEDFADEETQRDLRLVAVAIAVLISVAMARREATTSDAMKSYIEELVALLSLFKLLFGGFNES